MNMFFIAKKDVKVSGLFPDSVTAENYCKELIESNIWDGVFGVDYEIVSEDIDPLKLDNKKVSKKSSTK